MTCFEDSQELEVSVGSQFSMVLSVHHPRLVGGGIETILATPLQSLRPRLVSDPVADAVVVVIIIYVYIWTNEKLANLTNETEKR